MATWGPTKYSLMLTLADFEGRLAEARLEAANLERGYQDLLPKKLRDIKSLEEEVAEAKAKLEKAYPDEG